MAGSVAGESGRLGFGERRQNSLRLQQQFVNLGVNQSQ
jgi:hypothetical protein